jgi:hypothetical protein
MFFSYGKSDPSPLEFDVNLGIGQALRAQDGTHATPT